MNKYTGLLCLSLLPTLLLSACGGSGASNGDSQNNSAQDQARESATDLVKNYIKPAPLAVNSDVEHYQIAMVGNSHSSGLAPTLKHTIETMAPDKTVYVEVLGFGFTDNLINDYEVVKRFTQPDTPWTHLIIQGQKYSQSMSKSYSTEATRQWVAMAKTQGATPILFPEHPQRGNSVEGGYVHGIHKSIAAAEPSCLAPIAKAWYGALASRPELALHAADGNHADSLGILLSSLVFTQIITGQSVDTGATSIVAGASPELQGELAQHAAQAIAEQPACPENT
ncbi:MULTISPECIES: hypothetical protein [unclassified Pseudoalteromonas]|uniref:hypothetical protein n=1 Tax=unclassified Pseudoalteromonas TaxID=194690 RepID=UPI0020985ACD|nr:hypothetical protein [Pseudoalteromonas sp. XMcav2-N]MCO7187907.1 hypothetical protein [Pseudoalteromonas sp. XMcav2-N]